MARERTAYLVLDGTDITPMKVGRAPCAMTATNEYQEDRQQETRRALRDEKCG